MSRKTISIIGDSQSDEQNSWGIDGFRMWGPELHRLLTDRGANVRVRNFGVSGDTTTQMIARAGDLFLYDQPDVGLIYGGVNDPGSSITSATTQANVQALIKALKFKAIGDGLDSGATVAGQANLPATGERGQRYVVLNDTSTTGGAAAWHSSHLATITGTVAADANGQKQTVWEYRHPLAGEAGWGRVATAATTPANVSRIAVLSTGYLNYSTGGDTTSTPQATYAAVRTAVAAAATAEGVPYIDLYGFLRQRIVVGKDTQGSFSWQVADSNLHHNAYGNQLVARSVLDATYGLPAGTLTSWLAALS